MGVEELRDAVGGICMTEEMKKAVIDNVRKRTEASGGIQEKQKIQKIQKKIQIQKIKKIQILE